MEKVYIVLVLTAQLKEAMYGVLFKTRGNDTGFRHIFNERDLKGGNTVSVAKESDAKITALGFQVYLVIVVKKGIKNLFKHVPIGNSFYLFSHFFLLMYYTNYMKLGTILQCIKV